MQLPISNELKLTPSSYIQAHILAKVVNELFIANKLALVHSNI
jgi:hypothetical protein